MYWKTAGLVVFLMLCVGAAGSWGQTRSLKEADQLDRQLFQLREQGKYAEAVRLGERLVAIREEELGPDHPSTAISLNKLAGVYQSMGG